MKEPYKRMHRCCFTGHRPEKLQLNENVIKKKLQKEIQKAIIDGYTTFITGGARGIDLWAAKLIIEIKKDNPKIKLISAVPYDGMENGWCDQWKQLYRFVLKESDYIKTLYRNFEYKSFQERNRWMVDHCNRLIAVYNGSPGGTQNTINYARRRVIEICLIQG